MTKNRTLIFCVFTLLLFNACAKEGSDGADALPVASINSISQERTTTTSTFRFTISLDKTSSAGASVSYKTIPATAEENKDFSPVSGTVTIEAGQKQATVDVAVTGDSLRKEDQYFYIQIENPKNCTLSSKAKGSGNIINANGLYYPVDNTGYEAPDGYPGYTLVWKDDFNGNTVNDANWSFESGNNNGWGNNELEYYTNRIQNAFVSQGNLIIEARRENYQTSQYTSARMITKDKKQFTYGRVDIRAKLPKGKGIWPALWMLGSNISTVSWPACGEIDIMEFLGHETNKVYGTLHWGVTSTVHDSKGSSYVLNGSTFDEAFHVYSMEWTADSIKLFIDTDIELLSVKKTDIATSVYPFDKNFFFIFNVAVGGNWPGAPDNTTVFPQRMIVDYIKFYQ